MGKHYRDPNKDCPSCEGKGTEPSYWEIREGKCKEDERIPCPFCYALIFRAVHDECRKLLEQYSGSQSAKIRWDIEDDIVRGEEGQRFRRLLKWLWANPEDIGQDKNGFPRNGDKYSRYTTTPFAKLFAFERIETKPRIPNPRPRFVPARELFEVRVKDIKKAWMDGTKAIKKNKYRPIHEFAKVESFQDHIKISGIGPDGWSFGVCQTLSFNQECTSFLLDARRIKALLKTVKAGDSLSFRRDDEGVIIQYGNCTWTFTPEVKVQDFPREPELSLVLYSKTA
jgi:hypothetical protein